jgi:integration host factor subunit alpha
MTIATFAHPREVVSVIILLDLHFTGSRRDFVARAGGGMDIGRSKNGPTGAATPEKEDAAGKTTTRVELLDAVYNACPSLSRAQARELFEMTLEEIVAALLRDDAVRLRGFGAFNIRSKRERIGRNPRNGVEARIKARKVLTFKASPTLIARVNGCTAPAGEED